MVLSTEHCLKLKLGLDLIQLTYLNSLSLLSKSQICLVFLFLFLIKKKNDTRNPHVYGYFLSHVLSCVQLFVTLWTVAHQPLLSMGFSRQEYWSGLPFLPPGDIPDPGIKPASHVSCTAGRFCTCQAIRVLLYCISWNLWVGSTKPGSIVNEDLNHGLNCPRR